MGVFRVPVCGIGVATYMHSMSAGAEDSLDIFLQQKNISNYLANNELGAFSAKIRELFGDFLNWRTPVTGGRLPKKRGRGIPM